MFAKPDIMWFNIRKSFPNTGDHTMPTHKYDCLKLENQLCFPLYACAKEVVKRYTPFLSALDLTYTQYIAMMVLWEHKSLTIKQAGSLLYLDSGTLTPLFKKLEEKGLVTRTRSQADERNLIVALTEKGEALKDKALSVPAQMTACIQMPEEDIKQLYGVLHRMLDMFSQEQQ